MEKIYIINPIPIKDKNGVVVDTALEITIVTIKHVHPGLDITEIKELMLV